MAIRHKGNHLKVLWVGEKSIKPQALYVHKVVLHTVSCLLSRALMTGACGGDGAVAGVAQITGALGVSGSGGVFQGGSIVGETCSLKAYVLPGRRPFTYSRSMHISNRKISTTSAGRTGSLSTSVPEQ